MTLRAWRELPGALLTRWRCSNGRRSCLPPAALVAEGHALPPGHGLPVLNTGPLVDVAAEARRRAGASATTKRPHRAKPQPVPYPDEAFFRLRERCYLVTGPCRACCMGRPCAGRPLE